MRALPTALFATTVLLLAACATTPLPDRDRLHAELRYTNQPRELKASMFVAPFFRDDSRRLLSLQPPAELELLVTPKGERISPGDPLEILPAGTRVTVVEVGIPTRWKAFARPLMTPADRPWIELAVEGRPVSPSFVLVLRPDLQTEDELAQELDKLLTTDDVASDVRALPAADQLAVRTKQLAPGLTARGLELAFGTPILKKIFGEGSSVAEDWTWKSDANLRRVAHLREGVVVTVDEPSAKP
jgi:hypothetical protein